MVMKKKDEILKQVEETMGVLNRMEEVGPRPFFYTRLTARIANGGTGIVRSKTVKKLSYALYALILMVAINGYSIYKSEQWRQMEQESSVETFIENYQLGIPTVYAISENDVN